MPASHAAHVAGVVAPVTVPYRPWTQLVHTEVGELAHVPRVHNVHVDAPLAAFVKEPMSHERHTDVPTLGEYVPTGEHDMHDDAETPPVVLRNFPAAHPVHVDEPLANVA